MPYRMRRPEQVAEEFAATGEPYGVFIDNNLGSNRPYLHALCSSLRPLKKIWSAAVSIDVTDDPSLIRAMALAGCTGVFIGFESLTDDNLSEAHKKTPRVADYSRRVAMMHDHGIQVNGSFVVGFDHDREDVTRRDVAHRAQQDVPAVGADGDAGVEKEQGQGQQTPVDPGERVTDLIRTLPTEGKVEEEETDRDADPDARRSKRRLARG